MRLVLLVVAVSGCLKTDPLFCKKHPDMCTDGGMRIDAPDADNGIDARLSYGVGNYEVKLQQGPSGPVTFTGTPISTSGANPCVSGPMWAMTGIPDACFVVGTTITIDTTLAVTGSRPLVLVASDTITISATLDVAGHVTSGVPGPGAPATNCQSGIGPSAAAGGAGGGGGAGGSFVVAGKDGGDGGGMTGTAGKAAAADTTKPDSLRAGCNGQTGALGNGTANAVAGPGGGAVYLVAGNKIDISTGIINASGGGGGLASSRGGGGGGGAGGMVVLYAPTIVSSNATRLVANGGGGASGANGGSAGNDPDPMNPSTPALGGTAGGGCGTNSGGSGYPTLNTGGNGGNNCGGGGGGGGGGYIQANATLNGDFSPMPMIVP